MVPLVLGGPGATRALARSVGARCIDGDPVDAARSVSESAA